MPNNRGQLMPLIIAILFGFTILIATIVAELRNETRWTDKEKRASTAFHLAEAAVDRAAWKMNETASAWDDIILTGTPPAGYSGTTTFTEPGKGHYKILISTNKVTSTENEVIIRAVAADMDKKEICGIKTVYSKASIQSSLFCIKGIQVNAGTSETVEFHWGPMISKQGNINLMTATAAGRWFPRKFAGPGFKVIGYGSTDPARRDYNAAGVLPDEGPATRSGGGAWSDSFEKEWHSNSEVGNCDIVLTQYIAKAKAYRTPSWFPNRSEADPPNSGYYPKSACHHDTSPVLPDTLYKSKALGTMADLYKDYCSTATYFIEGNCRFSGHIFIGTDPGTASTNTITFIVLGNMTYEDTGGYIGYQVNVPTNSWREYQYIDTSASNQYPGDNGYRSTAATYSFPLSGDIQYPNFHGLLYIGGNLTIYNYQQLIGVVIVKGSIIANDQAKIYYTSEVEKNTQYMVFRYARKYWAEFPPGSFDSCRWQ